MENQEKKQKYEEIHYKPHIQVWFWLLVTGILLFIVGMIMNEMQSNVSLQKGKIPLIVMIILGLGTLLIIVSLIWYIAVYFSSISDDNKEMKEKVPLCETFQTKMMSPLVKKEERKIGSIKDFDE